MGRNIVIEPNRSNTGSTQQPHIYFSGLTAGTISLVVEDDGSIVFDGDNGALLSITDNKNGLLNSVNDISGLPILQVWDDNRIILGSYYNPSLTISGSTAFVGPTASTTSILHISGGTIQYKDGNQGVNKILTSDANGVASWQTSTAGGTFTGGTVTGATIFTNGLSANTISATTYQNLPTDIRVTGGTYSSGTAIFTNNTGGTFSVTGFSTSTATQFTGGTVTGSTIFTNGLSANTISATTYQNLPTDIRVTGATYLNNTFTYTNNTGGTFNTLFNTVTGLTVNGNLSVTGDTNVKGLSGTSAILSGSAQNILTIVGSGSTNPLFRISGSTGELFTVTDTTTGLIFTVNNNIGLPILQVWDDFRISMGSNAVPGLIVSGSTAFFGPTASTTSIVHISNGTLQYKYGSYGSGKILTSDANGVATWENPYSFNGGTISGLTINGTLNVTGATVLSDGFTATTISATTYQNLPTDIRVTGASYNNNTFTYTNNTGGTFSTLFNSVTGLTVNGNLSVTGDTNVNSLTGTSALFSGSSQNVLTVVGSGSTNPIFRVSGSSGELFTVTDSLEGSLFSVNNISGLPVLEVFSNYTTLIGDFYNPSLYTTTGITVNSGVTTTIYSMPTSAYTGAYFDYTLKSNDSTGARAGNIMAIWSGNTVNFTETKTSDIGSTTGVTFSMAVTDSGNTVTLSSSATTSSWYLKTIIRSI